MESNSLQFLKNKTIFITGAPGFLAKVLVEKILRLQPNVKKMYLLLRASDNKAAMQRLRSEVLEIDLFNVLRNNLGEENLNALVQEKIVPVPGDISIVNLGIKSSDLLQSLWSEIDIIINIAATTNFDERYDIGLGINTFGALNVLNFAKKCVKGQLLLHVSTAYVCGENSGLLLEKPFKMGETLIGDTKLDINIEFDLMKQKLKELQDCSEEEITQSMKDFGMARSKLHGWPNTYVFTKAMGEMIMGNYRENLPLVIIRPTMIPADMVINAMIASAAAHLGETGVQAIYHIGSSLKNPVAFGQLHDTAARYFTKRPLVGRNGLPIIVTKGTILSTMNQFSLYMTLRYKLPLQILRLINIIYPWSQGDNYIELSRKIKLAMRLVELYQPYLLFKGIFDDLNTERLRIKTNKNIKELGGSFEFDPKNIDWDNYMANTHIPGLVTFVLKQ